VKKETGLLITTEVANANHVKIALDHDVDVLWIGARSTVSPFIVQEIADALQNTDKIVLLKNPVNPDLSLWYGGIERLYSANIKKLGVIHRGFSTYSKTKFRNNPEWQIPIELQNKFPDLPLICDPSHICGRRDIIEETSQKALDLNFDGLMIETHNDPDNAWSDASQQITPKTLIKLMKDLIIRKESVQERSFIKELENLRIEIDDADSQILDILGNRMKVSDKIGKIKKKQNVAILQSERWKNILKKMISDGKQRGLSEDFILKIFKAIHQESINHQEKILKN
jgi:chorismate mutase